MKTAERAKARELRAKHGLPIKRIERLLGVAPTSVSVWVRDLELTPEQLEALREMNPVYNNQLRGATRNAERGRERRSGYQSEGRAAARLWDPLHAAGTMLYWAEGEKRDRNCARISNSDPEMLRLFAHFLRVHFDLPDEKFRVTCHLFVDHIERQREIEQYWLDVIGVPRTSLCKSVVNVYSKYSQKKRRNKLPYGTCRISVSSTRVVQHIYGAIQAYGGFERPEWLG